MLRWALALLVRTAAATAAATCAGMGQAAAFGTGRALSPHCESAIGTGTAAAVGMQLLQALPSPRVALATASGVLARVSRLEFVFLPAGILAW